jgi:hypothetical protein
MRNCALLLIAALQIAASSAGAQVLSGKSFVVNITPTNPGGYPPVACEMQFGGIGILGVAESTWPMRNGLYVELPLDATSGLVICFMQDYYFDYDRVWNWFIARAWLGQGGQAMFEGGGVVSSFCGFGCWRESCTVSGIVSSPPWRVVEMQIPSRRNE